jgi:small-conductance mechanosensitive channel
VFANKLILKGFLLAKASLLVETLNYLLIISTISLIISISGTPLALLLVALLNFNSLAISLYLQDFNKLKIEIFL